MQIKYYFFVKKYIFCPFKAKNKEKYMFFSTFFSLRMDYKSITPIIKHTLRT